MSLDPMRAPDPFDDSRSLLPFLYTPLTALGLSLTSWIPIFSGAFGCHDTQCPLFDSATGQFVIAVSLPAALVGIAGSILLLLRKPVGLYIAAIGLGLNLAVNAYLIIGFDVIAGLFALGDGYVLQRLLRLIKRRRQIM